MGAAGLGAVSVSTDTISGANKPDAVNPNAPTKAQKTETPKMPRRKLGKTGVEVSCLSLGGDFSFIDKQIILRKASSQASLTGILLTTTEVETLSSA